MTHRRTPVLCTLTWLGSKQGESSGGHVRGFGETGLEAQGIVAASIENDDF